MGFAKANQFTSTNSFRLWLLFTSLILICFPLLLLIPILPHPQLIDEIRLEAKHPLIVYPYVNKATKPPKWLEAIGGAHLTSRRPLKVGLVNLEKTKQSRLPVGGIAEYITIQFEPVSHNNVTWKKLFPEWINENPSDKCPTIPMPDPRDYPDLDVVVAKLPCRRHTYDYGTREEWIRDVHRLQVNLATARLIVENGINKEGDVYGVFIGKCEPMVEIFKCDDLVWHGGSYWVYKPHVEKLRQTINMPFGTCELASPYTRLQDTRMLQDNLMTLRGPPITSPFIRPNIKRRDAYVTVLHSSETYVCGAIALATSILQTNTTKDLIVLVDHTISNHSIKGLQVAGWKIKRIKRIRNPRAKANAYNEWNYSKLRVWQLTDYHKVMFIDSDFIILQNIDHFFDYPQLSASPNNNWLFNSGIMILEPSKCFFKNLMSKRHTIKSYNGGDQGFLNEVLIWWHRLTRKLNFMKFYRHEGGDRFVPMDRYTIHYLGFKPWLCYRDYDCNWDKLNQHKFASDDLHARWWRLYDDMPKKLQKYCGLTKELNNKLHIRRVMAQKIKLYDQHWKIEIKDHRQHILHA
ncbi:putative UDP-glucuronate:xylan alpha-glucuronosyltransferase 5 [Silene latifolia]|uniref:putative UDP-glucuronate:xylan alpha-glucuronosyltransferase 5 n=1 Tax=Silene latifolia TaxID=37657 RepID=UPI003D770C16